jgi:hypothetical protein
LFPLPNTLGNDPVRASVRFPLHLDVVLSTESRDYPATTEDVSANGVLFVGDELPPVESCVSFRVTMPADQMGGREDVVLHCRGRIVRHSLDAGGRATAAAVIDEYSLKADHA